MANPPIAGTILPQFQGDYYSLQNKQALAQALMGGALQNQASAIPTNMPVVPKFSMGAGLAQLGQALLAGKMANQTAQGFQNLGQQQMGYLMGTLQGQPTGQPAAQGMPADQPQDAVQGGAQSIPVTNAPGQTQPGGGLLAPGGSWNPSGMDPGKAALLYSQLGPVEYSKQFIAPFVAPTDATRMARAAGINPADANAGALAKNNTILAKPGEALVNGDTTTFLPPPAQPGFMNVKGADGQFYQVAQPGGLGAVTASAAARTAGEGSELPGPTLYDTSGNPLPAISRTGAATINNPAAPLGIRNNNPGNLKPGGSFAQYPSMEAGLQALDQNLTNYGKQGVSTLSGVINKWAPPTENDTGAYIKDVSQRLGISPDQKIDLSNPLVRQTLSSAIALHENGTQGVFGGGQAYSAPPLAAKAVAESTGTGQVDTMQKSYQALHDLRANGAAALQDLTTMATAAPGASWATVGPYGSDLAALGSNDAKLYAKSRDHLIATMGGQLGMNTDAGRAFVAGSIPEYGAPREALQKGLANIRGQIQANMLKSDFLAPVYGAGDAKAYNAAENQFDQNVTPAIANTIAMPAGPERAAQLQALRKQPGMEARLQWAATHGILK